ncbi:MAG: Rieske 2Fe-2S domain-containing protein [Ilumatobacteraceae bacterium]
MRATSLGHAGILVRTRQASIVCDPWFEPAFFGSWFPFPRNDQLNGELLAELERPSYLYISHQHADHLDETWLARHIAKSTPVLLPDFATRELERQLGQLGFTNFIRTRDGEEIELDSGLRIAIHVESSITDGPGGDSAIVISDGESRLVNQNDCRPHDIAALRSHGPVDMHWLQFSGAIWYPMVYEEPLDQLMVLARAKVESQFSRALHYVSAIGARVVVPSAGPPCFLDDELFGLNMITGNELSIFPDQTEFIRRLRKAGNDSGVSTIPGSTIEIEPDSIHVVHPTSDELVLQPFDDKAAYLRAYQTDWAPWLTAHKASWPTAKTDLVTTLQSWWQPLLAMAPTLRGMIDSGCVLDVGDLKIYIDFVNGTVEEFRGQQFRFRFTIQRPLVEAVVLARTVDWSNSLFLSCRFSAWREGEFNEYLYNFFKSLSVERMRRAEEEAVRRSLPQPEDLEEIELGDYVMQRHCPHRQADLSIFGEIHGDQLVCTLHGWRFSLKDGRCLNSEDRHLRVRTVIHRPD